MTERGTLRANFARDMLVAALRSDNNEELNPHQLIQLSVRLADLLIEELENTPSNGLVEPGAIG